MSNQITDPHDHIAIPQDWEPATNRGQASLFEQPDDGSLSALSNEQRQQLIRDCLGHLRHTYRQIEQQATRVRERAMADRQQGEPAMMARPLADDPHAARATALAALQDWFYRDGQLEKETSVYVGAISASPQTLGAVIELNRLKSQFSDGLETIRTLLDDEPTTAELAKMVSALTPNAPANLRRKAAGELVRQLIHPRLNIRQLVRHVPAITVCPDRIRWRWTVSVSSMRVSRSAVIKMLEARDDVDARYDLMAIAECDDAWFSWRKGASEDCRVSVLCRSAEQHLGDFVQHNATTGADKGLCVRISRNASVKSRMPVFYLGQRYAPEYAAIPPTARKPEKWVKPQFVLTGDDMERHERASKTEKTPFLRSLAIHRYVNHDGGGIPDCKDTPASSAKLA